MSRNNPERRRSHRIQVQAQVEVGHARGCSLGWASDVSAEGIQIGVPLTAGVGDRLMISIQIPGFAPGLDFPAEVRWVDFAGTTKEYLLGCRFVENPDTDPSREALIWELVAGNLPELLPNS